MSLIKKEKYIHLTVALVRVKPTVRRFLENFSLKKVVNSAAFNKFLPVRTSTGKIKNNPVSLRLSQFPVEVAETYTSWKLVRASCLEFVYAVYANQLFVL